jgi:hypothetical protein
MPSNRPRHTVLAMVAACALVLVLAPAASAQSGSTGGARYVPPPPPAKRAALVNGIAIPPASAPVRVKRVMEAANRIIRLPYVYGGGHSLYSAARAAQAELDEGYDCSGTVSFALFGGRFLRSPLDSGSFLRWGKRGKGRWITVYTNPGHAYVVIGGLRLDTSGGDRLAPEERRTGRGPRWRKYNRSPVGFTARHPRGY